MKLGTVTSANSTYLTGKKNSDPYSFCNE